MKIELYNQDCIEGMKRIPDASVDCVLTDPPYLYLKNQKLDRQFDEPVFFAEVQRILKKDGFVVLFGRGTSFYRWNTILAQMGFQFKEEIVWNKSYCSSPLMAISRVHETISIHTKGKGAIRRVKVPYLEMKGHDPDAIITDIKRLSAILRNPKSLKAVQEFLETNVRDWEANNLSISSKITKEDRAVSVMRSIKHGCAGKSIIRNDMKPNLTAKGVTTSSRINEGDRVVNVMQTIALGANEKTIIKQPRDHYATIHPTQKPVRLLERLLGLVSEQGDLIVDPFAGSASTGIACMNTGRAFIGFEIDREYYRAAMTRLRGHQPSLNLKPA